MMLGNFVAISVVIIFVMLCYVVRYNFELIIRIGLNIFVIEVMLSEGLRPAVVCV